MKTSPVYISFATVLLAVAGCATSTVLSPPNVPGPLSVPAGQSAYVKALATGVQIYECASKAAEPSAWSWTFRAPEATLADPSGRPLGKHYAGPTWESLDGSVVVGQAKASDPGTSPTAIPWLLLTTKSITGKGLFAQTTSVQRVETVGGVAPTEPCGAANAKQVARVPYRAAYYFYRAD